MKKIPRALFVLHADAPFLARLRQAAGTEFVVDMVHSWASLRDALRSAPPAAMALVDPYAGTPAGPVRQLEPELQLLLTEFPSTPIIAALVIGGEQWSDLRKLGAWGAAEAISIHQDDVLTIRRLLRTVRGRPLRTLLDRFLPETLSNRARVILGAAAEVVVGCGGAVDLARRLHVSPRTLLRWCCGVELPPPRQLLAWMRILLAAEMLDQPGRTVEGVAFSCGYAGGNGLRRAFAEFLGTSPHTARRLGAFDLAACGFRRVLEQRVQGFAELDESLAELEEAMRVG